MIVTQESILQALLEGRTSDAKVMIGYLELQTALQNFVETVLQGNALTLTINDWAKFRQFWEYKEEGAYTPEALMTTAAAQFNSLMKQDTPPDPGYLITLASIICKAIRPKWGV